MAAILGSAAVKRWSQVYETITAVSTGKITQV